MENVLIQKGSVPGTRHCKPGIPSWTNNHDAYASGFVGKSFYGIVCDGCGSAKHPEVGAKLTAKWCANFIEKELKENDGYWGVEESVEKLNLYLTRRFNNHLFNMIELSDYDNRMYVDKQLLPCQVEEYVFDYLLATMLSFVADGDKVHFFGYGDGVWGFNDEITIIESHANMPAYFAYNLINRVGTKYAHIDIVKVYSSLNCIIDHHNWQNIFVATDGLADLEQHKDKIRPHDKEPHGGIKKLLDFSDVKSENTNALQRRLAILQNFHASLNLEESTPRIIKSFGLLPDDTTVVAAEKGK